MKKNVFISFVIMLAVALSRFLITLALARQLPKAEVGLFNLLVSLSFMLSALGLLGQHLSLVRFFSVHALGDYSWKGFLVKLFLAGSLLSLAGSVVAGVVYHLDPFLFVACFFLTTCVMVQEYCGALFRAQHRYYLSLFIGQFMPVAFLAVLYAVLYSFPAPMTAIVGLYLVVALLFSAVSVYLTLNRLPAGKTPLPGEVKRQGYLLFGIAITFVLFNQADIMLVAGLINLESLAIYTVVLSIMKVYDFGSMALNHVLLPRITKMPGAQLRRIFLGAILFSALVSLGYLVAGEPLIAHLYKGKYNAGALLIPVFCLAGIFKLVYTVPSSLIAAASSESVMKNFLYVNVLAVVLNYSLNVYLISSRGLIGAALGAAVAWGVRVAGALLLSRLFSRMREIPAGPANATCGA